MIRIMCHLAKKLILKAKHQVLYSDKLTVFSAVVVDDVIKMMLKRNDVFQKSSRVISLHWGAKMFLTVITVKTV